MHRRRLLGGVAALLPVVGCLDAPGADREVPTAGSRTDGTPRTTGEPATATRTTTVGDVAVRSVDVTPALFAWSHPDAISTYGKPEEQFVVVTVAAEASPAPGPASFAFVADGTTYEPVESVSSYDDDLWRYDEPYGEVATGWLAFRVPKPLDAATARLTFPGGDHRFDRSILARLNRPPTTFEVREFAAPESVAVGATVTPSVTVANVGDADGRFVGTLERRGPAVHRTPVAGISLAVPAGGTATWTGRIDLADGHDEPEPMRLHLDWPGGGRSRTVAVEGE